MGEKYGDVEIEYLEWKMEGELIEKIEEVGFDGEGMMVNGGGYRDRWIGVEDGMGWVSGGVIEVDMWNVDGGEWFGEVWMIGCGWGGVIWGFGVKW